MPQRPADRPTIKEWPATQEEIETWKNRRIYSKSGKAFAFVRSAFYRQGITNKDEKVFWLVIKWTDKNFTTTVSTREGNLKLRDDGHYQIA